MNASWLIKLVALAGPEREDGTHLGLLSDRTAVELEDALTLYEAARAKSCRVIVEIGTGPGYSTAWLAAAIERNGGGRLVTIDPERRGSLWTQVGLDFPWIDRVVGPARPLPDLIPAMLDMVFHDGSHDWYNDVEPDLNAYTPLLRHGGIVALHDVRLYEEMGRLARAYFNRPWWSVSESSTGSGLLIAEKGR